MIIDIAQKHDLVEVSYTNTSGEVSLKQFKVSSINGRGFYDYVICEQDDPDRVNNLVHYMNSESIKKIPTKKFDFDELREFLLKHISDEDRNEIFALNSPKIYMCDIEINTSEGDVFPNPSKAEFPIDSIQITGPNYHTLVLTCNNRVIDTQDEMHIVEDMINDHYKDVQYVWTKVNRLKYAHIKFDDEAEMLQYYWKLVREKLHAVSFWNGDGFDVPYLWNRCKHLGVNMGLGSPTNEISEFNTWPKHRYVFDYMKLVQGNASDIDRTSFALGHCATEIVGIGKIDKQGSYKDLYNGDIRRFLTYGAVDTISMQFIHAVKNYTSSRESLVYYCHASLFDVEHVTALVHCLIWDELYAEGKINAIPHKKVDKVPYGGGYVKEPVQKFVQWLALEDFSALYPRVMQSYNISFENYMGKVKNDEEKQKLINEGYMITVNNHIYKNDKPYTLKKIETKLLSARYEYKNMQQEVYLVAMSKIDEELKRRGLH